MSFRSPRGFNGHRHALAGLAVLVGFVLGCDSGPDMAPVRGAVTLDGEPLRFGKVMFQNTDGGQPATGEIQPDGSFVLSTFNPEDGARVGDHRVRVVCYSSQDPAVQRPDGPQGDALGRLLIPEAYASLGASGLKAQVPDEGLQNYTIELSSRGPGK